MTTKNQYIAECRKNNPKPQYRTENGVSIQLTDEEYEAALESWAEMRVEQDSVDAQREVSSAALASARTKLAALGLTDTEIAALLGG